MDSDWRLPLPFWVYPDPALRAICSRMLVERVVVRCRRRRFGQGHMLFPQNLLVKVHGGLEVHIRDFDRGVGDERTCIGNVTHVTSIITSQKIKYESQVQLPLNLPIGQD